MCFPTLTRLCIYYRSDSVTLNTISCDNCKIFMFVQSHVISVDCSDLLFVKIKNTER